MPGAAQRLDHGAAGVLLAVMLFHGRHVHAEICIAELARQVWPFRSCSGLWPARVVGVRMSPAGAMKRAGVRKKQRSVI